MAGTLLADQVVLGDSATLSQNLVIKSNNDGTFSLVTQANGLLANYANDGAAATGGIPAGNSRMIGV